MREGIECFCIECHGNSLLQYDIMFARLQLAKVYDSSFAKIFAGLEATFIHQKKIENVMILKSLLGAGLALCCLCQIAFADGIGLSKHYSTCIDDSGGVTVNMLKCNAAEIELQDARLTKAYKKVMAQLSESRQKHLKDAQRAWIMYREVNCNFYANADEGGSMVGLNSSNCLMSMTASRAIELEGFK